MNVRQALAASLAATVISGLLASSSHAAPTYAGGNGAISFGVTDYGAPVPGVPTFIFNNFTNLNDILSSPGGTFLTANPVIANNIASYGPGPLPGFGIQVGGGNVNGGFGAGDVAISGPGVGFDLSDPIPGGGSASYEIASWNATYFDPTGSAGNYGNYLSIGGYLPAVGSAAAVSLVTEITSANPASPFFGGVDLPALVLADSETSPGVYSWVALGGSAAILTDGVTSTFQGLALNSIAGVIPAGDVFTVTSTLTAYADPASLDVIDFPDQSLLDLTGPLPGIVLASTPEPSSIVLALLGLAFTGVLKLRRRKRPSSAA